MAKHYEMVDVDEVDLTILMALVQDPRKGDAAIGKIVNLAASTIEKRIFDLRELGCVATGQLRIADPARTRQMLRYRIDIKINPNKLREALTKNSDMKKIASQRSANPQECLAYYVRDVIAKKRSDELLRKKKPGLVVEDVSILLGDPADLCATVLVASHEAIFEFVTEDLRGLDEVQSTSTSHVAWRIPIGWDFPGADGEDHK